ARRGAPPGRRPTGGSRRPAGAGPGSAAGGASVGRGSWRGPPGDATGGDRPAPKVGPVPPRRRAPRAAAPLLALALAPGVGLAACGDDQGGGADGTTTSAPAATTTAEAPTTTSGDAATTS